MTFIIALMLATVPVGFDYSLEQPVRIEAVKSYVAYTQPLTVKPYTVESMLSGDYGLNI